MLTQPALISICMRMRFATSCSAHLAPQQEHHCHLLSEHDSDPEPGSLANICEGAASNLATAYEQSLSPLHKRLQGKQRMQAYRCFCKQLHRQGTPTHPL